MNNFIASLALLLGTAESHLFNFFVFYLFLALASQIITLERNGGNKLASTKDGSGEGSA